MASSTVFGLIYPVIEAIMCIRQDVWTFVNISSCIICLGLKWDLFPLSFINLLCRFVCGTVMMSLSV